MKRGKTNQSESEHKGEMHYIYLLLLDKGTAATVLPKYTHTLHSFCNIFLDERGDFCN